MKKILFSSFLELPVSEEDKAELKRIVELKSFKKGSYVFRQGDACPKIYFIRNGLVKLVYSTLEGREYIKSFIAEHEMFGSLQSQLNGGVASFSAVAIEELEVEIVDYSVLQDLIDRYPLLQKLVLGLFQQLALKKEIREYEFLCLSAQQRYEKFCNKSPEMVARIKQADMALYLGITPIALSRIKNKK